MMLLTEQELLRFTRDAQALIRGKQQVWLRSVLIAVLCLLLVGVTAIDYGVMDQIYTYIQQPMPGEESHWTVGLFALTALTMAIALHVHAHQHPGSFAVRFLRSIVTVLIPLYAVGAGLALSATIYFDGGGSVFSPADLDAELFATVTEAASPSLVGDLSPYLGLIFSAGVGGLGLVALYTTHALLELIRSNIEFVRTRLQTAKEATECWRVVQECDQRYGQLLSERNLLAARDPQKDEIAFSHSIVAAINKELLLIEQKLTEQQLRIKAQGSRFEPHENSEATDFKELQRRVAAIKAITPKTILAAFRDQPLH